MKKIIGISILSLIFFISPVWGLDIDTEYAFLGDEIFIVLETIGDNEMAVIDGGVLVNEQWYYFDIEDIKITRITEDAEQGKVFGHTENNHNFYILWNVDGDTVELMGKMWVDNEKVRIIETVTVEPLF
jgi:GH15 family glucan-1,4-alpha-glucosidase